MKKLILLILLLMVLSGCAAEAEISKEPNSIPIRVTEAIQDEVAFTYLTVGEIVKVEEETIASTMMTVDLVKNVHIGDSVLLDLEDGSQGMGRLLEISKSPDPVTHLYTGRISVDEKLSVLAGEYLHIIYTLDQYTAILVPSKAIVRKGGEQYIYKYEDGKAIKQNVTTGLSKDDWIELVGVEEIIEVVTTGQNFVTPADTVMKVE